MTEDRLSVIAMMFEEHYISVQCFNCQDSLEVILEGRYRSYDQVELLIAQGDVNMCGTDIRLYSREQWGQIKPIPHESPLLLVRHCIALGAMKLHVFEDGKWDHTPLDQLADKDYSESVQALEAI